jgi:hypothetical protein
LERTTRIELAFSAWEAESRSLSVAGQFLFDDHFLRLDFIVTGVGVSAPGEWISECTGSNFTSLDPLMIFSGWI